MNTHTRIGASVLHLGVYGNMLASQLADKMHFSNSTPVRALWISLEDGSGASFTVKTERTVSANCYLLSFFFPLNQLTLIALRTITMVMF